MQHVPALCLAVCWMFRNIHLAVLLPAHLPSGDLFVTEGNISRAQRSRGDREVDLLKKIHPNVFQNCFIASNLIVCHASIPQTSSDFPAPLGAA